MGKKKQSRLFICLRMTNGKNASEELKTGNYIEEKSNVEKSQKGK